MISARRPRIFWLPVFILAAVTAHSRPAVAEPEGNFRGKFTGSATHFLARPGADRLLIRLFSKGNNFRLRTLSVDKIMDFSVDPFPTNGRPDFAVSDATYTFTDAKGDHLILNSVGYADLTGQFTAIAEEIFSVNSVDSTGRFAGAAGAGRVHSDVVIRPDAVVGDDIPDSDVVKTLTGEIKLAGSADDEDEEGDQEDHDRSARERRRRQEDGNRHAE